MNTPELQQSLDSIRKHGDIIDAAPRIHRPVRYKTHLGMQVPAMTVANMGSGAFLSMEAAASFGWSYPLLGAGAAIGGYALNRSFLKKEKRAIKTAYENHYTAKNGLGSVDIIRGSRRRLSMRSYIFDSHNRHQERYSNKPEDMGISLAHQAENARKYNIDCLALNIDFEQYHHLSRQPYDKFGKVIDTRQYHFGKHGIKKPRVLKKFPERYAYTQILETSPDQAMALAAELQKERIGSFVAATHNIKLKKLYERLATQPTLKDQFIKEARLALSLQLNNESTPSRVIKSGTSEGRTSTLHRITPKNQVLSTETSTYHDHSEQTATVDQTSLKQFFGYSSNSALIEAAAVLEKKHAKSKSRRAAKQPELLLAASLLLMTDNGARDFLAYKLKNSSDTRPWNPTFYGGLTDVVTPNYYKTAAYKLAWPKKLAGIAGALLISHVGGTWAHQTLDTPGHTLEKPLSIAEKIQETSKSTVHVSIDVDTLLDGDTGKEENPKNASKNSGARSSFGDIEPSNNNPSHYEITSLSGTTTNGYWRAATQDQLLLGSAYSSYPFTDAGLQAGRASYVDLYNIISVSSLEEEIIDKQPDLLVSRPLEERNEAPSSLPILDGYAIVGAQITDQAHPDEILIPWIAETANQKDYVFYPSEHQSLWGDYEQPELRYWLKKQPEPEKQRSAIYNSTMIFPKDVMAEEVDKLAIAKKVKAALGLPENAADSEVFERISNKQYSLEPFKRDNVQPINLGYSSRANAAQKTEIVSRIGVEIASRTTLLCNLANLALILGTGAKMNGTDITLSSGFLESNNDGHLTQSESHLYSESADGTIYDATPTELAPGEKQVDHSPSDKPRPNDPLPMKQIAIGLVAIAAAVGASHLVSSLWRRRPEVVTKEPKEKPQKKRYKNAARVLRNPHIGDAITTINSILYMRPAGDPASHASTPVTYTLLPDDPFSHQLIAALPSPQQLKQLAKENGIDYAAIPPEVMKSIEQLYHHRKDIGLHFKKLQEAKAKKTVTIDE